MIAMIQQKQLRMPISIATNSTCNQKGFMITIGKIPQKVKSFFRPIHHHIWRYRVIVRHLCLEDSAYARLTYFGLQDQHAQGHKRKLRIRRLYHRSTNSKLGCARLSGIKRFKM